MKKKLQDNSDKQARRYQLTLNNPADKGITHATIHAALQGLKSTVYYCMADEVGAEGTPHTHIYVAFSAPVRFSTIKNCFPTAHIESALGTSTENRDYILKTGKWASTKGETSVEGTYEEWGTAPKEGRSSKGGGTMENIYSMVKAGASNLDILNVYPQAMIYMDRIERVRQALKADKYATEFRHLDVTYIWGPTGTGKTRGVLEEFGYDKVCRITDYEHPFERYNGEDTIIFDEYRSQIKVSEMLNYLDGYPLSLPCRYANRTACYTKVYLISNIPLERQYPNVQLDEPATWAAFLRRIHHVVEYTAEGCNAEPAPVQVQLSQFTELDSADEELPF